MWSDKEKEIAARSQQQDQMDRERRVNRRSAESRRQANLETFIRRNFWYVGVVAVVCLLDVFCLLDFVWCLAIMAAVSCVLVVNFFQYITRNHKPGQKKGNVELPVR